MAIKNVEIQDDTGTIYYPHTDASVVKCVNGQSVETQFAETVKQIGNINDQTLDATLKGKSLTEMTKVLFTNANNGKTAVANALVAKGVSALTTDTFTVLASKINAITFDASKLLTGNTVMSISGTMPNYAGAYLPNNANATDVVSVSFGGDALGDYGFPTFKLSTAGYVDTTSTTKCGIYGFNPSVIKYGNPVGSIASGIVGAYTGDATAVVSDILVGKTAYVKGVKVTGTIPCRDGTWTDGMPLYYSGRGFVGVMPAKGFYTGTDVGHGGTYAKDANFVPENLLAGKTYFGLAGGIADYSAGDKAVTDTSGTTNSQVCLRMPNGYYGNGHALVAADPNFVPTNLLAGKTYFGLAGGIKVHNTSTNRITAAVTVDGANPTVIYAKPEAGHFDGIDSFVQLTEQNQIPANLLAGKTYFGLAGGLKNIGNAQNLPVSYKAESGRLYVVPANGYYDGSLSTVYMEAMYLQPSCILKNYTILGVVGNLEPGKKYASGSIMPDSSGNIAVTGLAFQPSRLYVSCGGVQLYSAITTVSTNNFQNSTSQSSMGFSSNTNGFSAHVQSSVYTPQTCFWEVWA